jgi:hypothetical protein
LREKIIQKKDEITMSRPMEEVTVGCTLFRTGIFAHGPGDSENKSNLCRIVREWHARLEGCIPTIESRRHHMERGFK